MNIQANMVKDTLPALLTIENGKSAVNFLQNKNMKTVMKITSNDGGSTS